MDDTAVVKLPIKKSAITCNICNQIWTNRQPKILSCFHTFCKECLENESVKKRITPGDVFQCSMCFVPFSWPIQGVEGLKSNDFFESNEADDAVEAVEETTCIEHGKDLNLLCITCNVLPICTSCTRLHPGHILHDPEDFKTTRKNLIMEQSNLITGLRKALNDQKSVLVEQMERRVKEAEEQIASKKNEMIRKIDESLFERKNILNQLNTLIESMNNNHLNFDYLGTKTEIEAFNKEFMKECTKPSCYFDNSVHVSLGVIKSTFKLNEFYEFASIKLDSEQMEGICVNNDILYITSWISRDPPESVILKFSTNDFQPIKPDIHLENILATGICFFNGNLYCGDWSNNRILLCNNGDIIPFASILKPFGLEAWSAGLLVAASDGVHKFNREGEVLWSNRVPSPFKWQRPCGIATDNSYIYVTDLYGHCVHKLDLSNGSCLYSISSKGCKLGELNHPAGIILAPSIGFIVANMQNDRLDMIDEDGKCIETYKLQFNPVWITGDEILKTLFITTYINQKRKAVVVLKHN
ncbi:unnamed protein product [Dimorphilus gyrociliatus]|uniref:RING-type domain-containing protein n=1 Tax=Dimorphilus gyrociliatus TaxID=2664684 RepID=A0A7I8V8I7_9ANNE|nr:unnamed protein product [Dimorphilus gyrociliatus]